MSRDLETHSLGPSSNGCRVHFVQDGSWLSQQLFTLGMGQSFFAAKCHKSSEQEKKYHNKCLGFLIEGHSV
jgi:hypothetical protein